MKHSLQHKQGPIITNPNTLDIRHTAGSLIALIMIFIFLLMMVFK